MPETRQRIILEPCFRRANNPLVKQHRNKDEQQKKEEREKLDKIVYKVPINTRTNSSNIDTR